MPKTSNLKTLQDASSLNDVADLLGYKPKSLSYILYRKLDAFKYQTFEIPKRAGGTRTISAPTAELKLLQRRLSLLLQSCKEEIDQRAGYQNRISHGFEVGRSIITNARAHRNRRFVLNVDLEDFFGTVHLGRIRGLLINDTRFKLKPNVATVLAQIACRNGVLPQGSPCSPVIANMIAHVMDLHLVKLASKYGCTYTRYADDLTFSTNLQEFPTRLALQDRISPHKWILGESLRSKIDLSGFVVNNSKTRMQYHNSRQEVTGLVVNKKVNVRSEYRRTVRAMVHSLLTTGSFDLRQSVIPSTGIKFPAKVPGKIEQLHGMLGFINRVDIYNNTLIADEKMATEMTVSKESIYRRFLIFKNFYSIHRPVIVCEGITDNIYLLHAIRGLCTKFPALVETDASGKLNLKVQFFRYPKKGKLQTTSTGKILGLTGGAGQSTELKKWLH